MDRIEEQEATQMSWSTAKNPSKQRLPYCRNKNLIDKL